MEKQEKSITGGVKKVLILGRLRLMSRFIVWTKKNKKK